MRHPRVVAHALKDYPEPVAMSKVGVTDGLRRPLLLFPFNGNAREALACAGEDYDVVGFIDDNPAHVGGTFGGCPVLSRAALDEYPEALVLAVPGSPRTFRERRAVIEGLGIAAHRFARVVHPKATVAPWASVGRNVLIMAGVVITSDAVIGDHVCILPNTVVHHDVHIGAWTLVGSNVTVAGGVRIGSGAYVGSGTSVRDGITIGDGTLVGLGSTVLRNVEAHVVIAGVPARVLHADGSRSDH